MRTNFMTSLIVSLAVVKCLAQEPQSYTKEYWHAMHHGAEAKVTIAVADEIGRSVTNANARVFFRMSSGPSEGKRAIGVTDAEGKFMAEGRTTDSVFVAVEKNGYYATHQQYNAASREPERLKDGRWLPWNPTIPVVLKRIRNPVDMILKFAHMRIPQFNEPLGFDLEKHDWVTPNGKGEVSDMRVRFETISETSPFRKLVVEFPGDMNGAYVRKKDGYSILKSDYNAMTNMSYEARIDNGDGKRGPTHVLLGGDDYLVFRVRSKVNAEGNLISAFYGKIYGPFDYFVSSRTSMRLITFFNPVENDTNLEFDGKGFGDGTLFGR